MSPVQKNLPQTHKILELFFILYLPHVWCRTATSQVSTKLKKSQSAPGCWWRMAAEVTALSLAHCAGQLSNNQICATLGHLGHFPAHAEEPHCTAPQTASASVKCSSWEVTSTIRRHKILKSLSFFPWCAKCNAIMRFAWGWRFLLQWLNRVTSPLHLFQPPGNTWAAPEQQMSCWEMLEGGGFVSASMWHWRQPYAI